MAVTGGGDNNDLRPVSIDSRPTLTLLSSETESTCLSLYQSSNTTSSETIADVSSDYVEPPSYYNNQLK